MQIAAQAGADLAGLHHRHPHLRGLAAGQGGQGDHIQVSPVTCHLTNFTCHLSTTTCNLSLFTCHFSPVIHQLSPATCYTSPATCHISSVTCHPPPVTFHLSHFTIVIIIVLATIANIDIIYCCRNFSINIDDLFTLLFTNSKFFYDFQAERKTSDILQVRCRCAGAEVQVQRFRGACAEVQRCRGGGPVLQVGTYGRSVPRHTPPCQAHPLIPGVNNPFLCQ